MFKEMREWYQPDKIVKQGRRLLQSHPEGMYMLHTLIVNLVFFVAWSSFQIANEKSSTVRVRSRCKLQKYSLPLFHFFSQYFIFKYYLSFLHCSSHHLISFSSLFDLSFLQRTTLASHSYRGNVPIGLTEEFVKFFNGQYFILCISLKLSLICKVVH